jgi:glycosyltransferase involved in cell wall biosynthesis
MVPTISVIMPTCARRERAPLLKRAIDSVLGQVGVHAVPLVVVNGPDRDEALLEELRADGRLRILVLEQADLAAAIGAGRKMVDTEWFTELDDDDVLIPTALATRWSSLQGSPDCDVVVTRGWKRGPGGDEPNVHDMTSIERDPLRAMLRRNWLLPGSWLCRTEAARPEFFDGMPRFLECTYLGLRFATEFRIRFLEEPTVVYSVDTPGAESRSRGYLLGHAGALRRLLELPLPPDVRAEIRTKVRRACHGNAQAYLEEGDVSDAWSWHLQSLREPGGWRYFRYTGLFGYRRLTATVKARGRAPEHHQNVNVLAPAEAERPQASM